MAKARQNLEKRYWSAPNAKVAYRLWQRMSTKVRARVGAAPSLPSSAVEGEKT